MKYMRVIGRIGKIKPAYTPQGKLVVSISVAINEKKGDQQTTLWVEGKGWEKAGEVIQQYAKVGDRIFIGGNPLISAYNNAAGEARASVEITIKEFEFLGDRASPADQPQPTPQSQKEEGDIPF